MNHFQLLPFEGKVYIYFVSWTISNTKPIFTLYVNRSIGRNVLQDAAKRNHLAVKNLPTFRDVAQSDKLWREVSLREFGVQLPISKNGFARRFYKNGNIPNI